MRFKTVLGKSIYKNCSKYRINWTKKERSKFQTDVKLFLFPFLESHIVFSEFPVFGSRMKIDIFDATTKVAYEINGKQHNAYVPFFAKNRSGYLKQIKRDCKKAKWCEDNGILLVEIFPSDMPVTKQWFIDTYGIYL